jgi:signal transduction histidine kinase
MASLTRRLTVTVIGGTAGFVGLAAALIWAGYRPLVWHRIENDLRADAAEIAPSLLRQLRHGAPERELVELQWRRGDPGLMFAVIRLEDDALLGSRHLDDLPPWQAIADPATTGERVVLDERPWRVWRQPINLRAFAEGFPAMPEAEDPPRQDEPPRRDDRGRWREAWRDPALRDRLFEPPYDHLLVMLRDVGPLADEERRVRSGLIALVAAAVALAGLGAWLLARGVLRPVRRMAESIGELGGSGHRLLPERVPAELRIVPDRINRLLDRIDASRERERQFHAAAAHELRTPLAGLRAQLEVALLRQRSAEEYRSTLTTCLEVSGQLQSLVSGLLQLARIDAGSVAAAREAIDWRALFERALRRHGIAVARVVWDWPAEAPPVAGDPQLLECVCDNLIGNLEHGEAEGEVRLQAQLIDAQLRVSCENPCHEAPTEPIDSLLDPFVRSSRERSAGHAGLGLSLVKALIELQGGSVNLAWAEGRFVVRCAVPLFTGLSSGSAILGASTKEES